METPTTIHAIGGNLFAKTRRKKRTDLGGPKILHNNPRTKMEFPKFEGGNPWGWILRAKKYFCYYQTLDDLKEDITVMYLEGDALDLLAWVNT